MKYHRASLACAATFAFSLTAPGGPPGPTEMVTLLSGSGIDVVDMNGDCAVSDVDLAMMIDHRLNALFGPSFQVFDADGDGFASAEDVHTAIRGILMGLFGKASPVGGGQVGDADVDLVIGAVVAGGAAGDVNLDGSPDIEDVWLVIDRYGQAVCEYTIDTATQRIFEYIGLLRWHGHEAFMAEECAPSTHLIGVSNTWPLDHPNWWKPNHMVGMSQSYNEPEAHTTATSTLWPANHLKDASATWKPPPGTHWIWYSKGGEPPPSHKYEVSATWPPGHAGDASSTWPSAHDQGITRTWWPRHTYEESRANIVPPMHAISVSEGWFHAQELSRLIWPPNHFPGVSGGWGPMHGLKLSSVYPPGHVGVASTTWPGPQPTWPPGHAYSVSATWGEPEPGDWPIFPPNHTWFTTFQQIIHPIAPRMPWP